jgi:RHH-type proline utilization regulon transcriptional repressor/proline dehydrogenase/delta 1-pyrroline-5-carboxylate dehydrogenase
VLLPGPTGERNVYSLQGRAGVLCLAANDTDRLVQLATVLAVDGRAIWPSSDGALRDRLPGSVRSAIGLIPDWTAPGSRIGFVLLHGSEDELRAVQRALAERDGAVVGVERLASGDADVPLERLVVERSLSVNTAAAGGNASLMTIG